MIKNNKGVTLVELLIVIVVMGIIAAFSIPAVGNIIENATKDGVLNDAIQVENAAKLYCSSTTDVGCTDDNGLSWEKLEPYIDGISWGNDEDDVDYFIQNATIVAINGDDGWSVTLEAAGDNDADDKVWEWPAGIPSANNRSHVAADTD